MRSARCSLGAVRTPGLTPSTGWRRSAQSPTRFIDVIDEDDGHSWTLSYADTSTGRIEYENPFRTHEFANLRKDYGASAMSHIADFALAVRGVQQSEFDEEDALMSLVMNVACELSAQNAGQRVDLPLADEAAADAPLRQSLTKQYGIDPMDVEGMMSVNYVQP